MSFDGKVILITGAASEIGADAARYLSKLGGKLALVDRNEILLEKIGEQINSSLIIGGDITTDAKRIIDQTIKHYKKLDILVNCAATNEIFNNIESINMNEFDNLFDVNVRSLITLTHLAVPYLEKTKGNIVNVSSMASYKPIPGYLLYCMSTAAIDQFTKCTAMELAPKGIRVNAINPVFYGNEYQVQKPKVKQSETSDAIAFLANDKVASFVTGTLMKMDRSDLTESN